MIYVVVFAVLILALITRRIGGSWFFPPAIYSLYWALIMLASRFPIVSKGDLTPEAMLVFLAGAYCFAIGGIFPIALTKPIRAAPTRLSEKRIRVAQIVIIASSAILIIMVPFFVRSIQQLANALRIDSFAIGSRYILGLPDHGGIPRIFRSWTSLTVILAFCAAWQYHGSPRDRLTLGAAVIAPLTMNILTFGRTPVFMLVIGVLAILLLRKEIGTAKAAVIFLCTLLIFFGMGVALKKGPKVNAGESTFSASISNLAVHHLSGPVGFGQVMDNPELVGEKGLSLRFFTQMLNSFGYKDTLPDNVLGYIGSDLGNVYTWYFAYWLDGRWLGVVLFSLLGGFISSLVYLFALRGNFMAGVAWGLVTSAILDSAVIDLLFGSAVPWLLIAITGWLLYRARIALFPTRRRSSKVSNALPAKL